LTEHAKCNYVHNWYKLANRRIQALVSYTKMFFTQVLELTPKFIFPWFNGYTCLEVTLNNDLGR